MSSGIGLANVRERLRVIYGATYQLKLTSEPGKGTLRAHRGAGAGHGAPDHRMTETPNSQLPTPNDDSLKVLVVDDEQLAREELCYQLERLGEVEVVGQAGNGLEALVGGRAVEPDLVFLDIQMPGLTGFEVARRLLTRGDDAPALVFVTAFDQHAIEAFEVNAVDYLLKPVEPAGWNRRSTGPAGGLRRGGQARPQPR